MMNKLSAREIEILWHIALWQDKRQIAKELFISEHTVIAHIRHIRAKLGTPSVRATIQTAIQLGIVEVKCSVLSSTQSS